MRVKKLMMVTALTASLVMSTMTVSAAPQETQTQSEVQYNTKVSESELAAIKKLFNAKEYAAMYPDVAVVYGDNEEALWNHFVSFGLAEGRALRKDFNVFAYRSAYKDLQEAFGTDLAAYYAHYANNGMEEGRPLTTIEKVTKAGIAVTGLRGQILAEPVPAVQPATAVSSASSSSEASTPSQGSSENSSSKPSENPTPAPNPEPSNPGTSEPSTPDPSEPSNPGTSEPFNPEECAHDGDFDYEQNGEVHKVICTICKETVREESHTWKYEKISGEDVHKSKCTLCDYEKEDACTSTSAATVTYTTHSWVCDYCKDTFDKGDHTWSDGTCTTCNYQCPHDNIDRKQVNEYTDYHIWYCKRCGLEKQEEHTFKDYGSGYSKCGCGMVKYSSN